MKEAVISLGSNLLDREKNLKRAIESLKNLPNTILLGVSAVYSTKPFLVPDKQEDYLNCCVKIKTKLRPKTLLGCCLGIEVAMGRKRTYKNAARIIDLDLLLYEDFYVCDEDLILPHPRIKERAFVMVPLNDLYEGKCALGFDFNDDFYEADITDVNLYKNVLL